MARRIDVELTSALGDGTWTWRAAGAREPRGTLDGHLLHAGAKRGDLIRIEVETALDGLEVVAVLSTREREETPVPILLAGGRGADAPGRVTAVLAPGREGARHAPAGGGPSQRRGSLARQRGDGGGGDARSGRGVAHAGAGVQRSERREQDGTRREGSGRGPDGRDARHPRREHDGHGEGRPREGRFPGGGRRDGSRRPPQDERAYREDRLRVGTAHREAVLAELEPQQRPIAEHLFEGGMPAVRNAIAEQNKAARAQGMPEVMDAPLVQLAEELLPRVREASWLDRAEAAAGAGERAPLRDLRALVNTAAHGNDQVQLLAKRLRTMLEDRIKQMEERWLERIDTALREHRVADALQSSARPPDSGTRFPSELAERLAAMANETVALQRDPSGWIELIEAIAASPVRRAVHPAALPEDPAGKAAARARQLAGQVPGLASLLGMPIPPPPGPRRAVGKLGRPPLRDRRPGRAVAEAGPPTPPQ